MTNNHSLDDQPKAYADGWIEWYKLKFKVTPDVLIPRPETELLVDDVIKFVKENFNNDQLSDITILDLGTGSGAIAIALAKNIPDVKIIASEVSNSALEIAKQNAKFHGVLDRIEFIESDLLDNIRISADIIVTNLPYIPTERIPYLESSVKDFEPHVALNGGGDGFELYRKLFQQINDKKWQPKLLLGEIDYTHGELAFNEAYNYFKGALIEVKKDLTHMQRILYVRFQY